MSKTIVMKFGGTSIGNAERIKNVAGIISRTKRANGDVVVVVSALAKVTDLLVQASKAASDKNREKLDHSVLALRDLHRQAVDELGLDKSAKTRLEQIVDERLADLTKLLDSIYELGELTPRALDLISSFGERISIHIVSAAVRATGVETTPVEATELITTTPRFGDARPIFDASETRAKSYLGPLLKKGSVPVVTGFIGSTEDGILATLGRGGSDYSATILGYCLDADEVWIWTDVDGVMTADPRIVPGAHTISLLSYNEAAELSYFGAKVLHPLTMVPAARKQIPIWIKNTFNSDAAGTQISKRVLHAKNGCKAISTKKKLSLITVQGKGLLGVHGIAGKVFGAMADNDINVSFISQASSEYNISFVVDQHNGKRASKVLHHVFRYDLEEKNIETIKTEENLALLAVVGDGMRGHPGVAGKVFSVLGDSGVNIMAIAQGSSERNISLVIAEDDIDKAVKGIHRVFKLSDPEEKR